MYIALHGNTNHFKALRHGSHSFTCNKLCLPYLVSVHQMAPLNHRLRWRTSNCSLLLIYRPREDERLSWPGWLICRRRFTHIVVTRRLQAERRTGSVRRPKTVVLPTVLRNQRVGSLFLCTYDNNSQLISINLHDDVYIGNGRNMSTSSCT